MTGKLAQSREPPGARQGGEPLRLHPRLRRRPRRAGRVPARAPGPLRADQSARGSAGRAIPLPLRRLADELAGRRLRGHSRGRDRRDLGPRPDRPDVRPHSDAPGRRTRHRRGQRPRAARDGLQARRPDRGLLRGGQREGRDPGPHRRPRRGLGHRRRRHGGGGSLVGSILQSTKLQLDRATALRDSMSAVRRGGTLSLTGVYAGPIQAFPWATSSTCRYSSAWDRPTCGNGSRTSCRS